MSNWSRTVTSVTFADSTNTVLSVPDTDYTAAHPKLGHALSEFVDE